MPGIVGFFHPITVYPRNAEYHMRVLNVMANTMKKEEIPGFFGKLGDHCGITHTQVKPIASRMVDGREFFLAWDGSLYNRKELREEVYGEFRGESCAMNDADLLLAAFMEYGPSFVEKIVGVFSIAVWDPVSQSLFLYRDRFGTKPLFFTRQGEELIFSSLLKGLFAHSDVEAQLDTDSLHEIFSLGPARTPGSGVFAGIEEVLPAHYLMASPDGVRQEQYWKLESHPHEDSWEETVERTTYLVKDAVVSQMDEKKPVSAFLSGGVDSSLVSAICAKELKKRGQKLITFSFDFVDNDKYFRASSFQPSLDRPYVDKMVEFLESEHHYLECSHRTQADLLTESVDASDLPVMGDIDSSLLYFCRQVAPVSQIALTGECADEVFGGYPWFHKKECFQAATFPWTMDLEARKVLFFDEFLQNFPMDEYVAAAYEHSIAQTPRCSQDTREEARRREIAWLNLGWFMQTLLNRMDRTSRDAGLEARVPFADHRLVQYIWNVPWDMKTKDGVVKGLLRESGRGLLPDEVLFRRKSPYPKTYDPNYENLLAKRVREIIREPQAPIMEFLDKKKVERFLAAPSDYGKPWYGQLMAAPQMMAYVIQVNDWMEKYGGK